MTGNPSGQAFRRRDPGDQTEPAVQSDAERAGALVQLALQSISSDVRAFDAAALHLAAPGSPGWAAEVERVLTRTLIATLERLWANGWQPVDLARVVGRRLQRPHADLLLDLVAAERRRHADATVAPAWDAQLAELGATTWWPPATTFLPARLE